MFVEQPLASPGSAKNYHFEDTIFSLNLFCVLWKLYLHNFGLTLENSLWSRQVKKKNSIVLLCCFLVLTHKAWHWSYFLYTLFISRRRRKTFWHHLGTGVLSCKEPCLHMSRPVTYRGSSCPTQLNWDKVTRNSISCSRIYSGCHSWLSHTVLILSFPNCFTFPQFTV